MRTYSRADRTAALRIAVLVATLIASFPVISGAQANQPNFALVATLDAVEPQPRAITSQERWKWVAEEILAPKSLAAGAMIGTWQTAMKSPVEWEVRRASRNECSPTRRITEFGPDLPRRFARSRAERAVVPQD